MKIQCNACEMAEASVMCCADEAALCRACDEKIHSANKLASKHLRVPLSNSPSQMPNCDICQETTGYFFCLEDRALLCRKCDFAIHTANAYVSVHQRFLLTGVKVGLEPKESVAVPSVEKKMNSTKNDREIISKSLPKRGNSMSLPCDTKDVISGQAVGDGGPPLGKASFSGGSTPGIIPDWRLDDFLGLTDFNQNYGFMEQGSSKVDGVKFGDSEWSPIYQSAIEDGDVDEYLGQVPEVPWTVPKIPSPPTSSGLYWPKKIQNNLSADDSVSVPDICCLESDRGYHLHTGNPKRQRNF
ncbi:hypothetical protein AAC387_Pa08g1576 [Persea americana]